MPILLSILLAICFIYFAGFGVTTLLSKKLPIDWRWFIPVTGYAVSQILFFFAFVLFGDAWQALFAAVVLLGLINGLAFWKRRGEKPAGLLCATDKLQGKTGRWALYIAILLIACWPYLLTGWGNYWHSGNEDIMDALNGRDSYLSQSLVTGDIDVDARVRGAGQKEFLEQSGIQAEKFTADWFVNHYTKDETRFQYSSVAFWSVLLDAPHKMDAFLVQALVLLVLMAQGVYLVARLALAMPHRVALFGSLAAVLTNFYLTSYFNGHEGSMMYNAVAPFLLVLGLAWIKSSEWSWKVAILPAIWLLFLANSYPYPLPYLLLPLAAYWLYQKVIFPRYLSNPPPRKLKYLWVLAVVAVVVVGYWVAWVIFEPARLRAAGQFRSWQTVFNYVGLFQYWGIWPSNLASSGSILGYLIQSPWIIGLSGALGAGLVALALQGFRFAWREGYQFFGFWLAMWLLFFPFMRYVVGDSYFFYKFLYLNSYIIFLMVAFAAWKIFQRSNKWPKVLIACLLSITGALNLANDVIAGWAISDKLYNRSARHYEQIATIPTEQLSLTFIDIPWADHSDVVRQVVAAANLKTEEDKTKAKYLLRMEGARDVVNDGGEKVVWQSELFRLIEAPAHNLVQLVSYWEPERELSEVRALPFRWVSDGRNSAFIVWVARPDSNAKFLHFCAESGPSVDFRPLAIAGRDGKGGLLGNYVVEGYSCHWVPVEGKLGPFTFSSEIRGRAVSPIEPRKLNYRISMVGVSGRPYDESTLATLTLANDIVGKDGRVTENARLKLQLGNGWYNYESFAGETFRWARDGAEIVLSGKHGEREQVELDVESGPSLGEKSLSLKILDVTGQEIASALVKGRQTLNLEVPAGKAGPQVLHIQVVNSDNVPVPNDHRILNFRVFKIGAAPL